MIADDQNWVGSIFGSDTNWCGQQRYKCGRVMKIETIGKDNTFLGLSPNSNLEALRQMSKVGVKRLRNWALTKLQSKRR